MRSAIKTGVVPEFKGEFFFLSNFYAAPFIWRNVEWETAEHAFQAAKGIHMDDAVEGNTYMNKVKQAPSPTQAKRLGRSVKIDLDTWEASKVMYMREIVHAKFSLVSGLAGQLINTGAMLLVEGNDWGDTFWGRSRNSEGKIVGLNTLGTLLMEERGYWLYSNFSDKKRDNQ